MADVMSGAWTQKADATYSLDGDIVVVRMRCHGAEELRRIEAPSAVGPMLASGPGAARRSS